MAPVASASGPRPLVVLHPFPLDATAWDPFLRALAWPGPVVAPNFQTWKVETLDGKQLDEILARESPPAAAASSTAS